MQIILSGPALRDCIAYVENIDEPMTITKEAIDFSIEELRDRGKQIKADGNTLKYSLILEIVRTFYPGGSFTF